MLQESKQNLGTEEGSTGKINKMGKENTEVSFGMEENRRWIQKEDKQRD